MTDEAREWCARNGVRIDEGGFPVLATVPGPPRECVRCGTLAEAGHEVYACVGGRTITGVQCAACARVQFTDLREWARPFKEQP